MTYVYAENSLHVNLCESMKFCYEINVIMLKYHKGIKQSLTFGAFLFQMTELSKLIREMKCILYGNSEAEPVPDACMKLTQEFFKENTFRLLVNCLPKLNLEVCYLSLGIWNQCHPRHPL